MGDIFSQNQTLKIIEKSLSTLAQRQKVLSNNVANVDTPGFKRSDIDFQAVLRKAITDEPSSGLPLCLTDSHHMKPAPDFSFTVPVYKDASTSYRRDGNNVDIDKEVVELNKNALMYESAIRAADAQFSLLKLAIEGGR